MKKPPRATELLGRTFDRLTILSRDDQRHPRKAYWICRCTCGKIRSIRADALVGHITKSCGCLHQEIMRTHTKPQTVQRTRNVWNHMMSRCYDPSDPAFSNYGARGVRVYPQWHTFAGFFRDVGYAPPLLTLDRYPNNAGHYEPGNIRWATMTEQQRNRRDNHLLTFQNRTMCLSAWSEITGLQASTIKSRIRSRWTEEEALTTPLRTYMGIHRPPSLRSYEKSLPIVAQA